MQRGGSSPDTWVLTDGPVDTFCMLPQRLQVDDIAQRRRPVTSRTAENLFWLGRYTERTEQLVRLARATLLLIDADSDAAAGGAAGAVGAGASAPAWRRTACRRWSQRAAPVRARAARRPGRPTATAGQRRLQPARAGARVAGAARAAVAGALGPDPRACARPSAQRCDARGRRAADAWPQVLPALDRLALQLAAMTGAQTDRMTRDDGWRLLTVGRQLERLIGLAAQLAARSSRRGA